MQRYYELFLTLRWTLRPYIERFAESERGLFSRLAPRFSAIRASCSIEARPEERIDFLSLGRKSNLTSRENRKE